MIKFLIEYLKLLGTVVLGILLVASLLFSIFGPITLAFNYSGWWGLLYIITLPYLYLVLNKMNS